MIDGKFWIWDFRYGSVLVVVTRAAGGNSSRQEHERPAASTRKQRQKKPLYEGLFDGNALPFSFVQYTGSSFSVKRKLNGSGRLRLYHALMRQ
jgi:hypothetical protein